MSIPITMEDYCEYAGVTPEELQKTIWKDFIKKQKLRRCILCGNLFVPFKNENFCKEPNPDYSDKPCNKVFSERKAIILDNFIKLYTVVEDETLSKENDHRFVVVNNETGEIEDDAHGYGYKSVDTAYAGSVYQIAERSLFRG